MDTTPNCCPLNFVTVRTVFSALAIITFFLGGTEFAHATGFTLGGASDYAVLYEGIGNHNLQITNVTVNGNIGVGNSLFTGQVQYNGPGAINGRVDFSAANSGQFHNNNGTNVGPTSVNYSVGAVTTALNFVNALSTTLGGEVGAPITINGNQTLNASSGTVINGDVVFNVTSYTEGDGNVLTINGDGLHNVVLNLAVSGNPQLGGDVILNGLSPDQVLWNYTGTNNLSLNNNASSFPFPDAFMGVILAPNAAISLTNANLLGRVFGGDSSDMQIVSGTTIKVPSVPDGGSTVSLLGIATLGLGLIQSRKSLLSGCWLRRAKARCLR